MNFSVSVIVPVYNEATALENALVNIDSFLSEHFANYEIIVVESGSTDGSGEICDRFAARLPRLRTIHEGERRGFGSALKLGYKQATKDLAWLVTVDIPFPLEAILEALPLLEKYDCVLSYRSKDPRALHRRFQSIVYNLLVKIALGLKVRQSNSAFKVFRASTAQSLRLRSNGWFIDAETLYRLEQLGVSWVEIPVELKERAVGRSSVSPLTFVAVLKELVFFRWRERD